MTSSQIQQSGKFNSQGTSIASCAIRRERRIEVFCSIYSESTNIESENVAVLVRDIFEHIHENACEVSFNNEGRVGMADLYAYMKRTQKSLCARKKRRRELRGRWRWGSQCESPHTLPVSYRRTTCHSTHMPQHNTHVPHCMGRYRPHIAPVWPWHTVQVVVVVVVARCSLSTHPMCNVTGIRALSCTYHTVVVVVEDRA